ncbi:MAG: hypothetical protein AW07_04570 [Candidatus Accumulibacter sp. SK-11]|nr:MAG: hypothetical protein AW07_04570 [Candidatus Accumulibacter sp. SK-11]
MVLDGEAADAEDHADLDVGLAAADPLQNLALAAAQAADAQRVEHRGIGRALLAPGWQGLDLAYCGVDVRQQQLEEASFGVAEAFPLTQQDVEVIDPEARVRDGVAEGVPHRRQTGVRLGCRKIRSEVAGDRRRTDVAGGRSPFAMNPLTNRLNSSRRQQRGSHSGYCRDNVVVIGIATDRPVARNQYVMRNHAAHVSLQPQEKRQVAFHCQRCAHGSHQQLAVKVFCRWVRDHLLSLFVMGARLSPPANADYRRVATAGGAGGMVSPL